MQSTPFVIEPEKASERSVRLHYLDWLRVLAILGVFLFHAVHPFDAFDWHIKNEEISTAVTLFIVFLGPWGIPFFFLLSGAGSWFALQRRSGRQYASERIQRLLIPFIIGSILLSPIQLYFEWLHKTQTGVFAGSLLEFLAGRDVGFNPQVFGWAGYHLWFLGFLFAYSLVALPLFLWLKGDTGRRFIHLLAGLGQKRGGIFLFVIPLVLVQWTLRPFFPAEHHWADFVFTLVFFVSGFIIYADERLITAVKRHWLAALILGIVSTLFLFAAGAADVILTWMASPNLPQFYLAWSVYSLNSWCWTIFMLVVGMRFLDFSNNRLRYGQAAIIPFYLFHQPVIIIIAFYVVQWDASILVKLPVVVLGSLVVSLGLYELFIKRIKPIQILLGIKPQTKSTPPSYSKMSN